MINKTLYVSNIIRLSKRGKINDFIETETEFIFNIEGKKKVYNYNKKDYYLLTTNKTVTVMSRLEGDKGNIIYK